jgi:4-amino-4-deoxy-L-arabinose transferase-like glycosyltransferase
MASDAEGRTRRIDAPAHRWLAPTLGAVLLIAAGLDIFRLWQDGDGNLYYAAAVKSMLTGWHPFFFVAFDPAGFISVDKPPLGLWLQTASAKLFGFHGLSLLLPQALAGVLSVALLYVLVRRSFGPLAGVVAALALALTPISVATNRNNTMDSLLVLLVLVAAYAVSHAAETGRLRPLLLCAALVGLGFNVKMLQAYLVLPAFALTYLIGAPLGRSRRLAHLALATVVLMVVSLSWAVVIELTPANDRPFIGSSGHNSAWDLILGYNGLDRVIPGAFPASGQQLGFAAGAPGVLRLLNHQLAGQVSWLLLPAILGLVAACWRTRWRVPFDRSQQALVLWGTWFITQGVFFSVAGLFHPYYLVMLAPAIAALTGIGAATLWRDYRRPGARGWLLPVVLLTTALLQAGILADFPAWSRWLTPAVVGLCALAAAALTLARIAPLAHVEEAPQRPPAWRSWPSQGPRIVALLWYDGGSNGPHSVVPSGRGSESAYLTLVACRWVGCKRHVAARRCTESAACSALLIRAGCCSRVAFRAYPLGYQRQVRTLADHSTIRGSSTKTMELRWSHVSHGKTGV